MSYNLYKFNLHSYNYYAHLIHSVSKEDQMVVEHLATRYPHYHYRYIKEEYYKENK